ncbi:hypothetical protein KEM48_014541 [Puccinia striiformis f. sp. tritici PST-130]|nr:hypothetical protein KEM48_014541 [Puccinia striiformis f. sp. tritici PST-130]
MQKAMSESGKEIYDWTPGSFGEFLEALTGQKEDDLQLGSISTENRDDLLKKRNDLLESFLPDQVFPKTRRTVAIHVPRYAAQCHANQPGIDQIFTIYLKRDSDCLMQKTSHLWNSVKNRNRDPNLEDENHNLTESTPNQQNDTSTLPAFVERTRSQTNVARTQNSRRASLSFNGMNQFGCLASQELRNVLQTLIDVEPDS